MKLPLLSFLVLCLGMSSCNNNALRVKYRQQLSVVEALIDAFQKDDISKVKKLIGVDLSNIGLDDELLAFQVHKMHEYLKESQIENEKRFEYKEYPNDSYQLVDITIELKKPHSGKDKISLIVFFVKYIGESKIHKFRIIDYNFN